jgi:hypothetical protein
MGKSVVSGNGGGAGVVGDSGFIAELSASGAMGTARISNSIVTGLAPPGLFPGSEQLGEPPDRA